MFRNVGFAITGSFCNHDKILIELKNLTDKGFNILPIFSNSVHSMDTRFGTAKAFYEKVKSITSNEPITTIVEAEPLGPKKMIDLLVVAPCTGNTLSKLANGITDTPVLMTAKAHVRNNKPVVIAVSTNDGLGFSLQNIAQLINSKNYFFVPFKQDDAVKKPKSLVADFSKLYETIVMVEKNEQIQPIII